VTALRRTERGGLRALGGRAGCVAQRARRACRRARGLRGVGHLALSPDGRHLYTAAGGDLYFKRSSNAIAVFRVAGR
jgi:hypothetical protein